MTVAPPRKKTHVSTIPPTRLKPDTAASAGDPVTRDVLAWYDRHRRTLPWRAEPGRASDPYEVWLSEIMLQQTTVAAVKPYYLAFLARWPTVEALASTPLDAVLAAWAGLGYYSRARNLHACAKAIVSVHGGRFPDSEEGLLTLPGVGAYTAAAIAAIAFERRAIVVDGNVERVMARYHAIGTPFPQAKPLVRAAMDRVTPETRCGDFAQAIMDLGATICMPKKPACMLCPLQRGCRAAAEGRQAEFPRKAAKKPPPTRGGAVFFVRRADGAMLLRTRPAEGLFGGMSEFPGTPWRDGFDLQTHIVLPPGVVGPIRRLGRVEHSLTHFTLILEVFSASSTGEDHDGHRWVQATAAERQSLPTLMRKVFDLAVDAG